MRRSPSSTHLMLFCLHRWAVMCQFANIFKMQWLLRKITCILDDDLN